MTARILLAMIITLFITLPCLGQEIPLSFQPSPNLPCFESLRHNLDSAEYDTVVLRIESKRKGAARLFWATHYEPKFNHPKSIWFFLKKGEHDYYFNIPSQNPNWIGWIEGFLVYPEVSPVQVNIKSARITRGNLITNLKSGWQEFWGPNGREVIGSTINLIPSSAIFGLSVNVYIYCLTAIIFLIAFAWQRSFFAAGRFAVYFALAGWLLLGLNADYNYFNIFKDNFGKYFGKNIEQKRAVSYGQDYYEFLLFAKHKLPAEPVYFGVTSRRYAADLPARLYLIPHVLTNPVSLQTDYLLVFYPEPKKLAEFSGFGAYARLNKNAYILKRNK